MRVLRIKPGAKTAALNAEDLRFFLAVWQARSIKGGARILRVDHSTVSRRLASLEEALGARLFERTPEGLVATDVAIAIAPLAERIESLTSELVRCEFSLRRALGARVRIAVSPVMADHFLIPRLPELMKRFPDIVFDIHADISRRSMSKREADIAIRQHPEGTPPAEPSALAIKVAKLGAAAYASPEYIARFGRPERPVRTSAATGSSGPVRHPPIRGMPPSTSPRTTSCRSTRLRPQLAPRSQGSPSQCFRALAQIRLRWTD